MSQAETIHRAVPHRGGATAAPTAGQGTGPVPTTMIAVFMLTLLPPAYFYVGGTLFTPERILMMILFVPFLVKLFAGGAGRIRTMDILMLFWGRWIILTLVYHHGPGRFPYAAITAVELVGGYLAGRVLIRNAAAYRTFVKALLWTMILLLPVALVELFTNRNLLQEIFGTVFGTYRKANSSYGRWGMERVMAGFNHPILFGLYCSMALASAYLLYQSFMKRVLVMMFTFAMTFMSLSAGPLIAAVVQAGLLVWGKITGERWWLLAGLTAFCYVTVDMLSNRTPITILINYITFNPATAWTRVNTFNFGILEVWANPVFGIGLNDWARPSWLTGSVDNFWLLMAMRHGIPGFVLIFAGTLLHCRAIWSSQIPSAEVRAYRTGYLITVISLFLTLSTVHIWGAVSVFVMFFLGAGGWFVDAVGKEEMDERAAPAAGPGAPAGPRRSPGRAGAGTAPDGRPPPRRYPRVWPRPGPQAVSARRGTAPRRASAGSSAEAASARPARRNRHGKEAPGRMRAAGRRRGPCARHGARWPPAERGTADRRPARRVGRRAAFPTAGKRVRRRDAGAAPAGRCRASKGTSGCRCRETR